ncbi:hypothetical protein Tco_0137275, partial [Tanacetum coccineum]
KRGLPYAHILLWLEENSKCRTPSEIDDIISVELPSPTDDPVGYKVVSICYMAHVEKTRDTQHAQITANEATKKTQKTLLKQMHENFNVPSTESLDSIFNRLQNIVSRLAILGENISQEDLNLKFLRSLPSEWNTHVVVWRNKPDLDTMSFDDL